MSILTVDVGGTFIKWAEADGYQLKASGKVPTPKNSFQKFTETLDQLVLEHHPEGIAFSLPGTMDPETGIIRQGGALQYNNDVNLIQICRERYSLPSSIENDARCAALAEAETGELKACRYGIVLVIGTGIGGALVSHGEILRGTHGYAGEFSIMLKGSLKKEGTSAFFSSSCGMADFTKKFQKELNDESLNGEAFMKLVKAGNEDAVRLFDEYTDVFADQLFSLQMIYDPERFVIGGGISADAFFVKSIAGKFDSLFGLFPFPVAHADVRACSHANSSNLIGALVNYYRRNR
ncbi:MAG: ROK family protein [Solobacterium sp.]|nr:ROK family protein [Solobacterium sp.]